jgi:hypothetical protein
MRIFSSVGWVVSSMGLAATVATACSSTSLPSGAVSITFPSGVVPSSCSGSDVFAVPSSDCSSLGCSGSTAYAVCNGGTYSACSCAIPSGYTLMDAAVPDVSVDVPVDVPIVDVPTEVPPTDVHVDVPIDVPVEVSQPADAPTG